LYEQLPETIKSDIDSLLDNTSITNMLRLSKQQLRKHINIKKQLLINHKMLRQQSLEELKKQRSSQGQQTKADIIGKIATKEMKKADRNHLRNFQSKTKIWYQYYRASR
jgi:hypothetical protein